MNYLTLACELCGESLRVRRGDLPSTCPVCRQEAHWRVTIPGEYTASDMRLLRALRISPADRPAVNSR